MTCILFRKDQDTEDEYEVASSVWGDQLYRFRSELPDNELVVARYSCLPFYEELQEELERKGSRLVNSYQQHSYIAEMAWYKALSELTPRSWKNVGWKTVPDTEHGYVVKGATNSRKFKWNTHMRAPDRDALKEVMHRLYDDPLIADQGLIVREYVPLQKLEEGINGMPITNEWRCFFLGSGLLASGFYWSQAECAEEMGSLPDAARELALEAAHVIHENQEPASPRFFVVDVGLTQEGEWIVIEVNDGQMSGLSMADPIKLYTRLMEHL